VYIPARAEPNMYRNTPRSAPIKKNYMAIFIKIRLRKIAMKLLERKHMDKKHVHVCTNRYKPIYNKKVNLMLVDYHVHSNISEDGENSMLELVEAAIIRGFSEICITDHYEGDDKSYKFFHHYDAEKYFIDIQKNRQLYGTRIAIKAGIEVGYSPRVTGDKLAKMLELPYDFVIGSVHEHDGIDYHTTDITTFDENEFFGTYYAKIEKMVAEYNFDCVGHFDLLHRYYANFGIKIDKSKYEELAVHALKVIIEAGKGLEINTSGLRQRLGDTMPSLDIMKMYRALGGEIVTIGSDAHYARDVGAGIANAVDVAKAAGFRYLTVVSGRAPSFVRM